MKIQPIKPISNISWKAHDSKLLALWKEEITAARNKIKDITQ